MPAASWRTTQPWCWFRFAVPRRPMLHRPTIGRCRRRRADWHSSRSREVLNSPLETRNWKLETGSVIHSYDAIVLGGGAAGLMCAITAGQRGRRVAVLEHADRIGKKVLISGGGRCNFTNLYCRPENFLSANPHFCKSALARYTPQDFIALVEKHHISYHEKTLGQLFCDRSAHDIVALLEEECRAAGIEIFTAARARDVRRAGQFA